MINFLLRSLDPRKCQSLTKSKAFWKATRHIRFPAWSRAGAGAGAGTLASLQDAQDAPQDLAAGGARASWIQRKIVFLSESHTSVVLVLCLYFSKN